jgi:exoribonuclease II
LRRYTDLVNQWQIIACVKHGKTAPLAAPFKPKDADLFSIISNFDATYSAYNQYQNGMERFWTLKYIQQQGLTELTATVFKEGMVRADDIPLVLPVMGTANLPKNAKVRVKLGAIDEITLDVSGTVIERLDTTEAALDGNESPVDDEQDEEMMGAVAITIAVDVEAQEPAANLSLV